MHLFQRSKLKSFSITSYGNSFVSIIQKNNIYGVQFHPEKSQRAGMKLIKKFSRSMKKHRGNSSFTTEKWMVSAKQRLY